MAGDEEMKGEIVGIHNFTVSVRFGQIVMRLWPGEVDQISYTPVEEIVGATIEAFSKAK